ncbi:MAG: hypothetical protein JNL70_14295 [Saprospiraceae bacterium]|nr:hypothetical protein [Saprospiraceae bacterium]
MSPRWGYVFNTAYILNHDQNAVILRGWSMVVKSCITVREKYITVNR